MRGEWLRRPCRRRVESGARRGGRRRRPSRRPASRKEKLKKTNKKNKTLHKLLFMRTSQIVSRRKLTRFQSPTLPHLSPAATSRELELGWKAAEKIRSFTTLATRSSASFMFFRAEQYLVGEATPQFSCSSLFNTFKQHRKN